MTVPPLVIAYDGSAAAASAVRVLVVPDGAGISGPAPAVVADDQSSPAA